MARDGGTDDVGASPRSLRKIRCVTFDCYGTLIDWEAGIIGALLSIPAVGGSLETARRLAVRREEVEKSLLVSAPEMPEEDSPDERYESLPYRPYREILAESIRIAGREQGIEVGEEEATRAAATMPTWEPFPDTRPALEKIRSRFPIGILSNVENEVLEATVEKIGVPFDLIVTAERVESYKPSPDHWYAAMHELTLDEDEILHLAASPFHDLETATLLGIPCVYVNRAGQPLLPEASPLFTVRDLAGAAKRLLDEIPGGSRDTRGRARSKVPHQPHRGSRGGTERSGPGC